jgi:hypothetical protein
MCAARAGDLPECLKWQLAEFMDPNRPKKSRCKRLKTLIATRKKEFVELKELVGS